MRSGDPCSAERFVDSGRVEGVSLSVLMYLTPLGPRVQPVQCPRFPRSPPHFLIEVIFSRKGNHRSLYKSMLLLVLSPLTKLSVRFDIVAPHSQLVAPISFVIESSRSSASRVAGYRQGLTNVGPRMFHSDFDTSSSKESFKVLTAGDTIGRMGTFTVYTKLCVCIASTSPRSWLFGY